MRQKSGKQSPAIIKSRHLQVYDSFEDASAKEAQRTLEQPPIERLRETVGLILRVYGLNRENLKNRPKSNTITFISCP